MTPAVASGQSTLEKKLIDRPMTISAVTRSAAEPRMASKVSAKAAMRRCVGPNKGVALSSEEGGREGSSDMRAMRAEFGAAFQRNCEDRLGAAASVPACRS